MVCILPFQKGLGALGEVKPEMPLLPQEPLAQGGGRSPPGSAQLTPTSLVCESQLLLCPFQLFLEGQPDFSPGPLEVGLHLCGQLYTLHLSRHAPSCSSPTALAPLQWKPVLSHLHVFACLTSSTRSPSYLSPTHPSRST